MNCNTYDTIALDTSLYRGKRVIRLLNYTNAEREDSDRVDGLLLTLDVVLDIQVRYE